jgi:hypothetical protein
MKKYGMIFCVMIQSIVVVAMDNALSNKAQIKKMEIVRRIFRQQRNTVEMSLESNSQTEDEMSYSSSLSSSQSSSGSFPIFIPKETVQEKSSNLIRSKHGRTPRQRESSKNLLYNIAQEAEKREQDMRVLLTFELFSMHFE